MDDMSDTKRQIQLSPSVYRQFKSIAETFYPSSEIDEYVKEGHENGEFIHQIWHTTPGEYDGIEVFPSDGNVSIQVYKREGILFQRFLRLLTMFHRYDVFSSGWEIGIAPFTAPTTQEILSCGEVGEVYHGTEYTFRYGGRTAQIDDSYNILHMRGLKTQCYFKETKDGAEYHWFGSDVYGAPAGYIKIKFTLSEAEQRRKRHIEWLIRDRIISKLYDPRTKAGQRRAELSYMTMCNDIKMG